MADDEYADNSFISDASTIAENANNDAFLFYNSGLFNVSKIYINYLLLSTNTKNNL